MIKKILLLAVLVTTVYVTGAASLPLYDRFTKAELLRSVNRELPPHASVNQMDDFMRRHTETYDLDWSYPPEFAGRQRQNFFDKLYFDRLVVLKLKIDQKSKTFRDGSVEIFYTFI